MDEDLNLENLVTVIWVVLYRQNLTACDTFNEETFQGPTQQTKLSFGFLSEAEALKFYEERKLMLKYAAGCAGDYYTYPVKKNLAYHPKRSVKIECVDAYQRYYTLPVPAVKVICPSCDGEGTELRGGLKGAAFSPEELSDPDFRESYFGGDYDVPCSECQGNKIILEPAEIETTLPSNMAEDYFRLQEQNRQSDAEDAAERRYFERARGG